MAELRKGSIAYYSKKVVSRHPLLELAEATGEEGIVLTDRHDRNNDEQDNLNLLLNSDRLEDYAALAVSALILILVLLFH